MSYVKDWAPWIPQPTLKSSGITSLSDATGLESTAT